GVCIILFALRFLRKGVDRLLEEHGGRWLPRLARDSGSGFMFGFGFACLAPSSSGAAAVATRLARQSGGTARGILGILLGANVGITVLVLAGAGGIGGSWPALIIVGVILFQFTQHESIRGVGQLLLSLAFVFLGLHIITQHAAGLRNDEMRTLMGVAANHPVMLAIAAGALTMVLQSSTATILLLVGIAAGAGPAVAVGAVLPTVAGANAGIAMNALIIGWGHPASRLPTMANAVIKLVLAVVAVSIAGVLPLWAEDVSWAAALLHLQFNLATAVFGMLGGGWLIKRLGPWSGEAGDRGLTPRYLTRFADTGDARMALAGSYREILRVAEAVRTMLVQLQAAWKSGDRASARATVAADDLIDSLDAAIRDYLASRSAGSSEEVRSECLRQLRYVAALESAGDVVESRLAETVAEAIARKDELGPDGQRSVTELFVAGEGILILAETVFATRDSCLTERLYAETAAAVRMVEDLRDGDPHRRLAGMPHEANSVLCDLALCIQRIMLAVAVVATSDSSSTTRPAATAA
ncbi:MAG: Na/Pi symporter, partial [Planctomycetota bacterium]